MKKFKSILALTASVLALSAFAAPVSAFADDTGITYNGEDSQRGNMTVEGGKAVSYTVVIPATVNVDATDSANTKNVVVSNASLEKGKSVFVKATSTYGDNTGFKMALKTGNSVASGETVKAGYTVKIGNDAIRNDYNFLEVKQENLGSGGTQAAAASEAGLSTSLTFALDGTYPVAGNYQDTLTFIISYDTSSST